MKKLSTLILALVCVGVLIGCDSVPKEDFDAIVAERNQLIVANEELKADYKTVCAERDALMANAKESMVQATVCGSFVAKVRLKIPGYILDGVTPMAAVVTSFQSGPFALHLGEELIAQVEEDGIYEFAIEPADIELTQSQYHANALSPETAIPAYNLKIASVTPAGEGTYGLDSDHLTVTAK